MYFCVKVLLQKKSRTNFVETINLWLQYFKRLTRTGLFPELLAESIFFRTLSFELMFWVSWMLMLMYLTLVKMLIILLN